MAREHARLLVSTWDDHDFTQLTAVQQIIYFALASSKDISWCGVLPLVPTRFGGIASDMSERKARAAIGVLTERRYLVVDEGTAEIAVRSFVRHDGILKQPNVTKAMVRALSRVHSPRLADVIRHELARAFREDPEAKGWGAVLSVAPDLFEELRVMASRNPSGNPLRKVG